MEKREFLKMVATMGESDSIGDFTYKFKGKIYGFMGMDDEDGWDDQGKYQYKTEKGQLVEFDKYCNIVKEFNLGVSRNVQRSGSYFSDYYYDYEKYEPFKIEEVMIPEVIIPAHVEKKEVSLKIEKDIYDEIKKEKEAKLKAEKLRKLEEEKEKERQEELKKKYAMNDQKIIQKVSDKLKRTNKGFTIKDMQREYFNIVEKEGLKDKDWLDYHRKNTLR